MMCEGTILRRRSCPRAGGGRCWLRLQEARAPCVTLPPAHCVLVTSMDRFLESSTLTLAHAAGSLRCTHTPLDPVAFSCCCVLPREARRAYWLRAR